MKGERQNGEAYANFQTVIVHMNLINAAFPNEVRKWKVSVHIFTVGSNELV